MNRILPILVLTAILLPACEHKMPAPSPEEQQAILQDAPELFATDASGATLVGLDAVYLGQPKEEALAALGELCPETMEYRGGKLSQNAWFRGCVFREPRGPLVSVRVGFWPRLDDAVATLEVKRTDVDLTAARERFRQFAGELTFDVTRPGMVEMRGQEFQMLADVDDGSEGPTHIAFGYSPKWVDEHADSAGNDS